MARCAPQLRNSSSVLMSHRSVRFSPLNRRVLGFALGAAGNVCSFLYSHPLRAGEPVEPCPSRESIGSAIDSLLGKPLLSADDLKLIEVVDLGDRYIIKVKESAREYTDESRDCAKRARVAAVFVALTLAPPDIGILDESTSATSDGANLEAAPKVPITAPVAPVAPVAVPKTRLPASSPNAWTAGAEIGAKVDIAPRNDRSAVDIGGQFQFIYASPSWGVTLGGDIPSSSTLEFKPIRVQQARYTAFAGMRLLWRMREVRTSVDVCATAAMLRLRQLDSAEANTVTRAEPALHLASTWALGERWISPFFGVSAELVPVTIPIAVEPRGIVGHSSAVWLGLAAGVAFGPY